MSQNFNLQSKIPLGGQVLTLSNSTAGTLNSTCQNARAILFSVETNDVRIRLDHTRPTLTTGVLFAKDNTYWLDFYNGTGLSFQRSTGTAKVSIQAFKNANDRDR
jgi:hypothetical protein